MHARPAASLQVIAQPDERYESYCRGCDFIREHIFPGGHLPSMGAMVEAARGTQVGPSPREGVQDGCLPAQSHGCKLGFVVVF